MLDWLQFIGEFLLGLIESILHLVPMFAKAMVLLQSAALLAPPFLGTIMSLMFAVIIIMWVVNLL